MTANATPKNAVAVINNLYRFISLALKDFNARCMVKLLNRITKVDTQKMGGRENSSQFACPLRTMYALVSPANIITMLAMDTHKINLWGCILVSGAFKERAIITNYFNDFDPF